MLTTKQLDDATGNRSITKVTVEQIENAIAKALSDLTGGEYEVRLNKLDLNQGLNAWLTDSSLLELTLRRRVDPAPF
jgi:hypothetical protein